MSTCYDVSSPAAAARTGRASSSRKGINAGVARGLERMRRVVTVVKDVEIELGRETVRVT